MRTPLPVLLLVLLATHAGAGDDLSAQVVALTGATTRVVWPRYAGPDTEYSGVMCDGPDHVLVVFDTSEGKERILQAERGSYGYPMITRDGTRVVWTDNVNKCGWICTWDGKRKEKILSGKAFSPVCLRWDPKTGEEWVYSTERGAGDNPGGRNGNYNNGGHLYAVRIEGLKALGEPQVVFKNATMWYPLSISEDGEWAATEVNGWPNCGLFSPRTGQAKPMSRDEGMGCFATIAPDASYRHFFCTGSHKEIQMFDAGVEGNNRRLVKVTTMPGNEGKYDMLWPKFTNVTRYLTVMWPYNPPSHEVNWGNITLGRFNEAFTEVEAWVTISSTRERQSAPEAWIMPGPSIVATPAPISGLVLGSKVTIALATPLRDVQLVYTLDGSEPVAGGKTAAKPVDLPLAGKPVVVKARAIGKDGALSAVSTLTLTPAVPGVEVSVWPAQKGTDAWSWFAGEPSELSVAKGLTPPPRKPGIGAIAYRALLSTTAGGEVTFTCNGRLTIDGKQVADNGSGKTTLMPGLHEVQIRMAGKDLPKPRLTMTAAAGRPVDVPANALFLPADARVGAK